MKKRDGEDENEKGKKEGRCREVGNVGKEESPGDAKRASRKRQQVRNNAPSAAR